MEKLLLALTLSRKRDVIEARQRARQIAGLLGFDDIEQACIAAGVFALASQTYRACPGTVAYFQIGGRCLQVGFGQEGIVPGSPRIERPLPETTFFAEADIHWMIAELSRRPPPTVFQELEKLNQELVQTLLHDSRQRERASRLPRDKTA